MKKNITIGVDGMHCASCSARVERALNKVPGVFIANVNLPLEEASVEFDDTQTTEESINQAILNTGYKIRELPKPEDTTEAPDIYMQAQQVAWRRMWIAWALTIAVMLIMIPHMFFGKMIFTSHYVNVFVMTGLSLATMLIPARQVYTSAFISVKHGSANMDVLIALGTIAAVITGPLSLFISLSDFSFIAAMIIAFHLTGRYLESRAKGKASEAIRKLMNLGAKTALLWKNNEEYEIPAYRIKTGDLLLVKPGAKIPTDGVIVEGTSAIDESMATGEAMPVDRKPGDAVLGATINTDGRLIVQATRVGKDTFLAQIVRLVQEAQHSKVPIQVLADRITGIFVPIVLVLAAFTFALWFFLPEQMHHLSQYLTAVIPLATPPDDRISAALFATIALLVIACPCALGLATPTALMVGSGIGAIRGVLIRNGEALQMMKDIRVIVFDKTGTLTHGKPVLIDTTAFSMKREEALRIAASLEAGSEHPIAQAIISANPEKHLLPVSDFLNIAGKGITAVLEDTHYYLGSAGYIASVNDALHAEIDNLPAPQHEEATPVYLASDSGLAACFYVADTVKEESADVVKSLQMMGIRSVMLSGDNVHVANAIARQCGIDEVLAQVLPQDKAEHVTRLRNKYGAVAMVGDGINDAPALKAADIGIAMGHGTDIAMEAADITIVRSDLTALLTAIRLSRKTFATIRQNLFWAFIYNLVAIPLAVMGVLHPVIAEMAMATSSVTVVTNANLLRSKRL